MSDSSQEDEGVLHCYELLSVQYLEHATDDHLWERLCRWASHHRQKRSCCDEEEEETAKSPYSLASLVTSLPKELWFIVVLLREHPDRFSDFVAAREAEERQSPPVERDRLVANYLESFRLTELHLDTIYRGGGDDVRPPIAIFRCCPNAKLLSLKNNCLDSLPPDIGRLRHLEKLCLTNNRLQNGSIPYTLAFCTSLEELYLDDNLLDALPSVLLRMPSLKTVHRHGNHNYFKSTFMWYHTDVTGRILFSGGSQMDETSQTVLSQFKRRNGAQTLQYLCATTIVSARINFYAAEIPYRLKNYISDLCACLNLCGAEDCPVVREVEEPGYKVFTFRNPYLGNTCVPFLHWACDHDCARDIEVPARREQIRSAMEQDKRYENYVRESVDKSASSSNVSLANQGETESTNESLMKPLAGKNSGTIPLNTPNSGGPYYTPSCEIL